MAWSDQQSLFVSFGDTVRVCNVRRRDPNNPRARELPHYMVEILYTVPLEGFWISGLAPMDKLVVLLTSPKGDFQLNLLRAEYHNLCVISTIGEFLKMFDTYFQKDNTMSNSDQNTVCNVLFNPF